MIKATETTSGTTCILRAQDLSERITDDDRYRWTGGKMRHALAALGETPVIICTDRQTGHTMVNVILVGLRTGWGGCGYEVGIRSAFSDGSGSTIWHRLDNIGDTIVPLAAHDAKWAMTRSYADEASYAVELAQAQHGKAEGHDWGVWTTDVGYSEVAVTYTPSTGNPHFADRWGKRGFWTYKLEECRAQGCMRQARMHAKFPAQYDAPASQADVCENPWHRGLFAYMTCAECPKA